MDWLREIDGYCERLGPGYWAEPVNAVTNLAFVLAAVLMWWRTRGARDRIEAALIAVLALIGLGSFLFHTYAQVWAALADTLPIVAYVLIYIYAINRAGWGLRMPQALLLTGGFFPYAAATVPLFGLFPGLGGSAAYAPIPFLILVYAALLHRRAPALARGLALGAGILVLSITFRALDDPLCGGWPLGTHFLWHLLNALMLGWMIEVYHRHRRGIRA
ncbi:ceramidase domain-containing protein [Ruegeria pomeroyi]|nr:ceramidase domain-containing protein [Ruegeria pomeroyi]MCE8517853.1 ceramidase domain-containing protein [Ruegeria pomeroyi]MCE8522555.1 ceramidase domain-containing protein [Ruegeria pomeroyi]MCE8526733.1 ceramidase domain-containing protein [Ruegeria pomeroyi]MCE8530013.1 ceramidase domain-containing protein [Ruegeria pomeroyi]